MGPSVYSISYHWQKGRCYFIVGFSGDVLPNIELNNEIRMNIKIKWQNPVNRRNKSEISFGIFMNKLMTCGFIGVFFMFVLFVSWGFNDQRSKIYGKA